MTVATDNPSHPFDPHCLRFAAAMNDYDSFVEADDDGFVSSEAREGYVIEEEGTYNPENGHFLCDSCYIKAGQPSSPGGWKCP